MSNQNHEELIVEESITPVVYLHDKAAIDVQISTARAYPRNIARSISNAIAIVSMDIATAQTCTYSVPRGGKAITGPSVHMAKILAQVWGNMRIDAKVVDIDGKHVTSEAVAFDLENNLAIKTQVKRNITGKTGRFNDDMITVTGNAANAIAMRNAILAVIPRAIVDKVYNAAKQMITGDVSDKNKLTAQRKKIVDALKDTYEVTEKEILSAIGRSSIDHITGDDLVILIGIGQAIKDGDTTTYQAFRAPTTSKSGSSSSKTKEQSEVERATVLMSEAKTHDASKAIWDSLGKDLQVQLNPFMESKYKELDAK